MAVSPRSPNSDIQDRVRAASERATAFAHQSKAKDEVKAQVQVEEEEQPQVQVAERTATELKMKDNPFYQTFESEQAAETTQEEKILALANALDPKQQTMDKLRENYRLFQEYYTYLQSEELDQVLANIHRLITELQSRSKVEIAEILKNLRGMLDDVAVSRDLVEVMRRCRLDGTTVSELSAAYDRNAQLVTQLRQYEGGTDETGKVIVGDRKTLEDRVAAAKQIVDTVIADRAKAEGTFGHWCKSWVITDTTHSDRVTSAQAKADREALSLKQLNEKIDDLKQQRREEFEKEPLKILRSLDEADDNLSQRLVSAGQRGIGTINGAQQSILQLMQRAVFSEEEVDKIARRVTEKRVTLANLRSGLTLASTNTNGFKQTLEQQASTAEAALTAARTSNSGDVLAAARLEDESLKLKSQAGDVTDYQGKLNDTIGEITGTVAKNLEREQETDRNRAIVQGTKKSISMLGRDTLNTVAGNLEGVLHNLVADQTDEVQNTVIAFGQSAQTMMGGMLESQVAREREMHKKDMTLIDDTIQRLKDTTSMIADALDKSVDEGIAKATKQRELEEASRGLDSATTTFRRVVGELSDNVARGQPTSEPQEQVEREQG